MTAALQGEAWKIRFPRNQKTVMLRLADWANDDHLNCWCYLSTLADYCSMSESTVKRALKELEKDGVLVIQHNKGKEANKYWLNLEKAAAKHGKITPRYASRPPWQAGPPPAPTAEAAEASTGGLSTGGQNDPPKQSTGGQNDPLAGQIDPLAGQNDPPNIEDPLSDPRIRKEGAAAVDNSAAVEGDGRAGSGDPAAALEGTPVNALWKAKREVLLEGLGEDAWNAWLSQCIPLADDGTVYTLACPTVRIATHILDHYAPTIAELLERAEVRCVMRPWVGAALERQAFKEREAAELEARYAVGADEDPGQSAEDLEAEDAAHLEADDELEDPEWDSAESGDELYFDDDEDAGEGPES